MSGAIPYFVGAPLAAAFIIAMIGKKVKAVDGILSALTACALTALSLIILSGFGGGSSGPLVYRVGGFMPPAGISMVVDWLSLFMLITVNTVAFMIAIYSIGYVKKYTDTWKFYSLFSLMLAGINGVLVAGDIFNLYIFMEIAAISAYFLVAFGTGAEELEAAFKYAVMGGVASSFILLGIGFLYSYTSTLNMADISSVVFAGSDMRLVLFVSVLFLMGFGLKAALVPFHAWLPYAHSSAPAPVSAMLSGVLIKVLGIYALARIFFNLFGANAKVMAIIIALGVISMVVGSILAFGQTDIKRLFAYSSISQIGYIALGLGLATPLSIFGALFHLFNHSVFKSLLFLNSGAIENVTGTREISKIKDVASRSPVTGYTTLIGALSICGMPPLGGFWSKLIIILACIKAGHPLLALIAAVVSILTLAYYFKALSGPIFERRDDGVRERKSLPWTMVLPMVVLAVLSMISGLMLLPNTLGSELLNGASAVLTGGSNYANILLGTFK